MAPPGWRSRPTFVSCLTSCCLNTLHSRAQDACVHLLQAGDDVLPHMDQQLRRIAAGRLAAEQIEVNTDARVAPVDDAGVDLKDGSRIDAGSVVWAAGVKSSSIVSRINAAPVDDKGRLKVDENLRLLGQDGVYALGDIAAVTSAGKAGAADRSGHHPRGCGSGRQPGRRADGRPATSVRLSSLGDARRSGESVRGQPGAQPQALWRHRTGAVASRFTTTSSAIAVTGWV